MIPNLSGLKLESTSVAPVSVSLYSFLARKDVKGAKDHDNCHYHQERLPDTATPEDYEQNCATEGYLMVKILDTQPVGQVRTDLIGQDLQAMLPKYPGGEAEGKTFVRTEATAKTLTAVPRQTAERVLSVEDRMAIFQTRENLNWIRTHWKGLCMRYKDEVKNSKGTVIGYRETPVLYESYKDSLVELSDWYYIDRPEASLHTDGSVSRPRASAGTSNRGLLFIKLLSGKQAEKTDAHLPYEGVFSGPYLYIVLVCAAGVPKFGGVLLEFAEQIALMLGVGKIVLSALSNAAGVYYSKGYRFATFKGMELDISRRSAWVVQGPGGKQFLYGENDDPSVTIEDLLPQNAAGPSEPIPQGYVDNAAAQPPRRNDTPPPSPELRRSKRNRPVGAVFSIAE